DPPSYGGQFRARKRCHILTEHGDEATRWAVCEEHEFQERGLARAGRAGEKMERARREVETHIAQDLRSHPVAHTYILKPNHAANLSRTLGWLRWWCADKAQSSARFCPVQCQFSRGFNHGRSFNRLRHGPSFRASHRCEPPGSFLDDYRL